MSHRQWGQGDARALLLHCSLAQSGAWAGVARHLGQRLRMTAPDLIGHGGAPDRDPGRDYHDQATEAVAAHLLAAQPLGAPPSAAQLPPDLPSAEPWHLIGHSLGATIALRLALDHPGRVQSLTLIEPVLFCASAGPGRAAHDRLAAGLPAAMARGDRAGAVRLFLDLWGSAPFDSLPADVRADLCKRIWVAPATEPALLHDRAGLLPRLPGLAVPTLLIEGERRLPVIAEILDTLAAAIPGARRATIPGAAHMAPVTHPAETASAIAGFLDDLG